MSPRGGPILVVEDHPEMRDAVVTVLEREGWAVVAASNGEEALDQLSRGPRPSLLLDRPDAAESVRLGSAAAPARAI